MILQQKMGSMAGTFTIPEFNSSHTITDSNLVRIYNLSFCSCHFDLFTLKNSVLRHNKGLAADESDDLIALTGINSKLKK
jgi:hypothetical protein